MLYAPASDRRDVRTRAASVTADELPRLMLGSDGRLAAKLGVEAADTALATHRAGGSWCVVVTIDRLIASGQESFLVSPGGPLRPVRSC